MKTFLGTVLSVIAIGVLMIAYGLLGPRASAADIDRGGQLQLARPMYASERLTLPEEITLPDGRIAYVPAARPVAAYPVSEVRPAITYVQPAYDTRPAYTAPAPRRTSATRTVTPVSVDRTRKRDWPKTAMVIGGSSAAGAGIGGLIGGKKGALIGAALGGGAGTLYELRKK